MAILKTVYVAKDGRTFDNEPDCLQHEIFLDMQSEIEVYIAEEHLVKANAGFLRKHLAGFALFQKSRQPQAAAAS